ncbi:hypothetical protein MFLAVUS_002710 [Mucor flavus]|uniref:Uncharacterized protein n=1 Tax=Mucor flavus TaxID=439312 RepID=A0ABP9YR15_9FUNG
MRSVFAITTAIALFAGSALATNADFNPVNFLEEAASVSAPLTDAFVTFRWKGGESVARESFDLMVEHGARIQITDFKNRGDMFEIFDNGKSLGMTTKVDAMKDDQVFAATPEEALKDDRFSKGVFDLAKGAHKITIKANGPYEAGTAAIRVLNHSNVAFHKKGGKHDDDDEDDKDDKHHDDDDDEDDKHHDDDDDEDDKHHDDDDDDEDDKHHDHHDEDDDDKDYHKKGGKGGKGGYGGKGGNGGKGGYKQKGYGPGHGHGPDKYPIQNIDLSHTMTLTKTKWVVEVPTLLPPMEEFPSYDHDYEHKQGGW